MESALTQAVGKQLALAEKYPQLRANEGVQQLQEQFVSTENRIAYARQFYNDEVMKYNTVQATFPPSLFAAQLGFSPSAMFAAADAERANVQVKRSKSPANRRKSPSHSRSKQTRGPPVVLAGSTFCLGYRRHK